MSACEAEASPLSRTLEVQTVRLEAGFRKTQPHAAVALQEVRHSSGGWVARSYRGRAIMGVELHPASQLNKRRSPVGVAGTPWGSSAIWFPSQQGRVVCLLPRQGFLTRERAGEEAARFCPGWSTLQGMEPKEQHVFLAYHASSYLHCNLGRHSPALQA